MLNAWYGEEEAVKVLATVNEKVAAAFGKEPAEIEYRFYMELFIYRGKPVVGYWEQGTGTLALMAVPGWQNTAIHELAHVYNPGVTEKRTDQIARDIIRYLKAFDN